jgi:uncharacterized repeat protein (TIGR03943 family)
MDARYLRLLALVVWATFFAWLWATDERVRYLGARTYWVVVFGAVVLAACALAYGVSVIVSRRRGPSVDGREAAGLGLLVLPIVAVLLVPSGTLGASAATSKSSQGAPPLSRAAKSLESRSDRPPSDAIESFVDLAYAVQQPGTVVKGAIGPGQKARTVGFVAHFDDTPDGHFELTRFAVSCCVADAVPLFVRVDHRTVGEYFADDLWFEVTGKLVRGPRGTLVLRATQLTAVPVPDDPYVSAL